MASTSGFKISGGPLPHWRLHDLYGPDIVNGVLGSKVYNALHGGTPYHFNPINPHYVWPQDPSQLSALQTWLTNLGLNPVATTVDKNVKG